MQINLSTFNLLQTIIFRSNIFNYDNKYLNIVKEINSPINIKFAGKNTNK